MTSVPTRQETIGGSRLHLPHGTTPALDLALWALAVVLVVWLYGADSPAPLHSE